MLREGRLSGCVRGGHVVYEGWSCSVKGVVMWCVNGDIMVCEGKTC